mmetsp:Transcript_11691/g.17997  ORF Transcript_11691/g.17997 Transcript_11691/m.17997 type:complete len:528 (-) Transcript_11691:274-1857(-)
MAEAKARAKEEFLKKLTEAGEFERQVEDGGIPQPELWSSWEVTKVKKGGIDKQGIVHQALIEYHETEQKEQQQDDGSQKLRDELMKYVTLLKEEIRANFLVYSKLTKKKSKRTESIETYGEALDIFMQLVVNVKKLTKAGDFERQVEAGGIPQPDLWLLWEETEVKKGGIEKQGIVHKALVAYHKGGGYQKLLDGLMKYVPLLKEKINANAGYRQNKKKSKRIESLEKYREAFKIFMHLVEHVERWNYLGVAKSEMSKSKRYFDAKIEEGSEVIKQLNALLEWIRNEIIKLLSSDTLVRFRSVNGPYDALKKRMTEINFDRVFCKVFYTLIPGLPNPFFSIFQEHMKKEFSEENMNFLVSYAEYLKLVIESDDPKVPLNHFHEMWTDYIDEGAKQEINLPAAFSRPIKKFVDDNPAEAKAKAKSINIDTYLDDESYGKSRNSSETSIGPSSSSHVFDDKLTNLSRRISGLEDKVYKMSRRYEKDFAELRRLFRDYEKNKFRQSRDRSAREKAKIVSALRFLEKMLLE